MRAGAVFYIDASGGVGRVDGEAAVAFDALLIDDSSIDASLLIDAVPIDAVPIDAVPIDAVPIDECIDAGNRGRRSRAPRRSRHASCDAVLELRERRSRGFRAVLVTAQKDSEC